MGRKKMPPPPPTLGEQALMYVEQVKTDPQVAGALVAVVVLALSIMMLFGKKDTGQKVIKAKCELGVGGRPNGEGFRHSQTTPIREFSGSHIDKIHRQSSSNQFIPALADKPGGLVELAQKGGVCTIKYVIKGMTPGKHGFRINEMADFSRGGESCGGIYNPFGCNHGGPESRERCVGSLGNITADATGVAKGAIESDLVKLTGRYSVVGRSFMVHADEDDLGKGDNSEPGGNGVKPTNGKASKVTGNAGMRICCGEIKMVEE
jgi:Cu-Zn family superoxide dismutase